MKIENQNEATKPTDAEGVEIQRLVSPSRPPKSNIPIAHFFERSGDPFHADAAPDEFKSQFKQGAKRMGWMAIDWCGNPIGFVEDGTEMPTCSPQENLETAKKVAAMGCDLDISPHKMGTNEKCPSTD